MLCEVSQPDVTFYVILLLVRNLYTVFANDYARIHYNKFQCYVPNEWEDKEFGFIVCSPPGGMSTAAGSKSLCTYSKANVRPSVKCSNDAPELSNTDSSELLKTLSEDSSIQPKPVPVQVATRSSGRLAKRPRKDINPPLSPPKKSCTLHTNHDILVFNLILDSTLKQSYYDMFSKF